MEKFVIIGAGPAGLTAALELLRRTELQPVVLEATHEIGGISRTVRYKGNRMDIGGHRFFSKSDRVMQWWMELMPPDISGAAPTGVQISYQGKSRPLYEEPVAGPVQVETDTEETDAFDSEDPRKHGHTQTVAQPADASREDLVMLVRPRKSRIYYLRKFFDYPIKLSGNTLQNLGPVRMVKIGFSYVASRLKPIPNEKSLEDFLINRFGRELYLTFFKSYTEKVWGTSCREISAEWGAQRIKGLSLTTAVKHFVKKSFARKSSADGNNISQQKTETSLIERFLYPKFGPGQLWEHVADLVAKGGELHQGWTIDTAFTEGQHVLAVEAQHTDGSRRRFEGDRFLSTMPMKELVRALARGGATVPDNVREVSEGLQYRDFITVGMLANRLEVKDPDGSLIRDTWIYIQEPDVLLGRLQIFNNWSPYMVGDVDKVWIGLEYFCYESDPLWSMPDEELKAFAASELEKIGILKTSEVLDAHIVRVPKTYPAYFGTYNRFEELRTWLDGFENLYLVGRNGMHKYNNQDHSMLTAMHVVDGIVAGNIDKQALWKINTEQEYHEEKQRS